MGTSREIVGTTANLYRANLAVATQQPPEGGMISATTDEQLVDAWLSRSGLADTTIRNARKETGRFMMWCGARGKQLRQVRFEDFVAYSAFMLDPQPAEDWVCATRWPKTDDRWRPFAGPLSDASHRQALAYIKALFYWATAAQYLVANPAGLLGKLNPPADAQVERYLPVEAIAMMMEACLRMPSDQPAAALRRARARLLVKLLYLTGARLDEVASANMTAIRSDDSGKVWFHVVGKGNKKGKMPVSRDLLGEFKRYRVAFGLAPLPPVDEVLPLLLTTRGPLRRATNNAVYSAVRLILRGAADVALELGEDATAARLGKASTHWLRHSAFTHQADAGVPLKTIQNNARHSSLATTSRYLHKDDDVRHAETVGAVKIHAL